MPATWAASVVYLDALSWQYRYAALIGILIGAAAWGIARRAGALWLLSLIGAPILWFAMAPLAIWLDDDGSAWYQGWYVFNVGVLPMILVGLLGWLIDWLQHRREADQVAPSNPGNGTFDPAGPTQLRG